MRLALARDAALDLLDRAATARPRLPRRLRLVTTVLVVLAVAVWWLHHDGGRGRQSDAAPLVLSSTPAGATVLIDGHDHGRTPAIAMVPPGAHRVVFRHPTAFDVAYPIDVAPSGS